MSLQDAADAATVGGVVVATVALVFGAVQLWLQRRIYHREKAVQVYLDCVQTYADLQKERAEFDDEAEILAVTTGRRRRNRVAYWDLIAVEREFAASGLLPHAIFIEWFGLLHQELHSNGDLVGATYLASWKEDGAPFAGRIFPQFSALMESAITKSTFDGLRPLIAESLKAKRPEPLFKSFQ